MTKFKKLMQICDTCGAEEPAPDATGLIADMGNDIEIVVQFFKLDGGGSADLCDLCRAKALTNGLEGLKK